jgi:lipid-A-disaccharide synthase
MNGPTLWLNAGELSGDMQGALLLEELRRRVTGARFLGMGGVHLAAAGLETLFRVEDLSVMGITEVVARLPKILRLLSGIKRSLAEKRPDALIAIDAPDFNFRVIKSARKLGIPVYYYISPKVWAWREQRVRFLRENARRIISILPFEREFYARFGMEVDYVGNPLVDIVNYASLKEIQPESGLIGFLPGSRKKEIVRLLPPLGGAARILRQRLPHLRFVCMRAPGLEESLLRSSWPEDVPVAFVSPDQRWAFMRRCEMLVAASGTVTLESALAGVPTIVTYKLSPLSFAVGKRLIKVPFISLPNLILGREVFPELLQKLADAVPLADAALAWLLPRPGPLPDSEPLARVRHELDELRGLLGEKGAPGRAADVILGDLERFTA